MSLTSSVKPVMVLIRMPLSLLMMTLSFTKRPVTVSESSIFSPPSDPMEMRCPPHCSSFCSRAYWCCTA
ncbi:hypothetical protein PF010_g9795 [Phytophthora fragariae]|uniref:RxLR effector protein n=1 Tax=Phytophthora fragariae TaxID=53985 RepID=A0A6G0LB16_9STRA|nr:hypothetical protein PF010_g9795 [Phytophthora fragariae]